MQPQLLQTNPTNGTLKKAGTGILGGLGSAASYVGNLLKTAATSPIPTVPKNTAGNSIQYTSGGVPVIAPKPANMSYASPAATTYVNNQAAAAPAPAKPAAPTYTPPAGTVNVGTATNPKLQSTSANPSATNPQSTYVNNVANSSYQPAGNDTLTQGQQTAGGTVMYDTTTGLPLQQGQTTNATGSAPGTTPIGTTNPVTGQSTSTSLTAPAGQTTNNAFQDYLSAYSTYQQQQAAQAKALSDQKIAEAQGSANIQGRIEPIGDQTGQQAALSRNAAIQENALNTQNTYESTLDKNALDASQQNVAQQEALLQLQQDSFKPVAYGGSLVNTLTGQQIGGISSSDQQLLGQALANNQITTADITRYGLPAVIQALQSDPNYSSVGNKANNASDTASLQQQQQYADTTTRAYNTATANLQTLQSLMSQYGINQSSIPAINQITNKVKAGLIDPGAVAAFNSALQGLRSEYAQVLARGGSVTDTTRGEATSLIPDDLSPSQVAQVTAQLNAEGQNAITEANQSVSDIQSRLSSGTGASTSGSASGGSSLYDF